MGILDIFVRLRVLYINVGSLVIDSPLQFRSVIYMLVFPF